MKLSINMVAGQGLSLELKQVKELGTQELSGNMGRKKGRTIEDYEKDQRALELRKEVYTYEAISGQLGYSTPSASSKAVMKRLRDMDKPMDKPAVTNAAGT